MQRTCKLMCVGAKEKAILEHGNFGPIFTDVESKVKFISQVLQYLNNMRIMPS